MTRTSIPRLHSVRFKDGRAPLRVLHRSERSEIRERFVANIQEISAYRRDMAGYVIIAWSRDGGTSVCCRTSGDPYPIMLMPEFVKTCVQDWIFSRGPE